VVHGLAPINIRLLTAHTGGARDNNRFHPVHVANNFDFPLEIDRRALDVESRPPYG
jgi:hypothetical protein